MSEDYMYNATSNIGDYDIVQRVPVLSIILNSVILYLGLCVNFWMIWTLSKSWSKGSRFHFYFLALCIADILQLCTGLGRDIGVSATVSWQAGNYGCKFVSALVHFTGVFGHLLLAGFNIDNFVAIIRRSSVKILRVVCLLAAIFLGVLAAIPMVWLFGTSVIGSTTTYCAYRGIRSLWVLVIFPYFWLPLAIIFAFVSLTLVIGCCKKGDVMKSDDNIDDDVTNYRKTTGLIIAYDVVFFLCLLPSGILTILMTYTDIGYDYGQIVMHTSELVRYLLVGKPLIDAIVYAIHRCVTRRGIASAGL